MHSGGAAISIDNESGLAAISTLPWSVRRDMTWRIPMPPMYFRSSRLMGLRSGSTSRT